MKKISMKRPSWQMLAGIVALLLAVFLIVPQVAGSQRRRREVITVPTLEKIVRVSELSTFTAVYNGIAQVMNEKKAERIDYYVSYEAKVDAGIDFEKIAITVDAEGKTIQVTLPPVYITDIEVDIASLDYIFMNEKSNASSVTEKAYRMCEADVRAESEAQDAIFELATQNAQNILSALISPILEQLDAEYILTVN